MDKVRIELAFSRFGADVTGQHRPLSATAQDGSLVMVCSTPGFTRPGTGVLRYSAKLSEVAARRSQIELLRAGLDTANSARTPVRLIIQTPATGGASARFHMRADLVGSIAAFDGDAYSVDFVPVEEPEPPPRGRRKR